MCLCATMTVPGLYRNDVGKYSGLLCGFEMVPVSGSYGHHAGCDTVCLTSFCSKTEALLGAGVVRAWLLLAT